MTLAMQHAVIVSNTMATRRLRRFAPVPVLTRGRRVMLTAVVLIVAIGIGVWAGWVLRAFGVAAQPVVGAAMLLTLFAGVGAGTVWADVRASLMELRSWWLYAGGGVTARSFLLGRLLVDRGTRLGVAQAAIVATLLVVALAPEAGRPAPSPLEWAAVLLGGPGAAACGLGYAQLRLASVSGRRSTRTMFAMLASTLAFVSVAVIWAAEALGALIASVRSGTASSFESASSPVLTAMLCAAAIAAVAVAVVTYVHCGAISWAAVTARAETIGGRASRRLSRARGGRRFAELFLLDLRRASRSFEWRVRPALYTMLAMALAVVMLGALGRWFFAEQIAAFSAEAIGATVVGGVCAGYVFVVFSTMAPLVSLDSDRRASLLMRTLPHGARALASTRAGTGALVVGVTGVAFIGLLCAFLPLGARAIGTAAVACAVVAVVAPTLGCLVALRYPQTDWKEVSEIGQRGWARVAVTYAVGIAIAASIAIGSALPWSTLSAGLAVLAAVLVPLPLAAAITSALPTTIGVPHHARH